MLSALPSRHDEAEAQQLPPSNIEAEEALLGAILIDPEAIARILPILPDPQAFYIHAHRHVYAAAVALKSDGKPTDLMFVASRLKDAGRLESVGGQIRLAQLVDRCVSSANVDHYAQLIADKYIRRQLASAAREIERMSYALEQPLPDVLDAAEQRTFAISQQLHTGGVSAVSEIVSEVYADIEARAAGLVEIGVPSGFYDLDAITQGFQRTDLIIAAARPAMGKTALLTTMALHIGAQNLPVLICSLEMSKQQIVNRMLSQLAKVESGRLRTGGIAPYEWQAIADATAAMSDRPIFIDDTGLTTVNEIASKARQLKASKGQLGLIVVDYLQLMESSGDSRVTDLDKITRGFKRLARELDVPVVLLSQLSRGVESRTNKRPMMSDLRESGGLEQNADVVMMLYREEYYDPDTADRGIAEVILTKHRSGPTGTVKLLFQPQYALFLNRARPIS